MLSAARGPGHTKCMSKELLGATAGQVARALGVSFTAVHDAERRGIVQPKRTTGGWRVYSSEDVATLREHFSRGPQPKPGAGK